MFLIMSVLIGFGVSTLIGREAMYLCLLLELVNLLVLHARAGALLRSGKAPQPSPKMRLMRRVSGIGWLTGAVLLVGSLALLLFGLPLANISGKQTGSGRHSGERKHQRSNLPHKQGISQVSEQSGAAQLFCYAVPPFSFQRAREVPWKAQQSSGS